MSEEDTRNAMISLVILFIMGWATTVIAFYKSNFVWFVIGNVVLGLVALTSYHIMSKYKEVEDGGRKG